MRIEGGFGSRQALGGLEKGLRALTNNGQKMKEEGRPIDQRAPRGPEIDPDASTDDEQRRKKEVDLVVKGLLKDLERSRSHDKQQIGDERKKLTWGSIDSQRTRQGPRASRNDELVQQQKSSR